ncbi:hypothetical protein CNR27_01905 [Luteimonas chenhongjianii]|uniref:Uncharacterized protein n=1 Tax=Luteimonas chenhongjianii TaxID=2006110 RepID=A0A290XBA4_9GAMM|nr:hypothetical protein CNR27_01905 [Luteimonas chenhongjianii]
MTACLRTRPQASSSCVTAPLEAQIACDLLRAEGIDVHLGDAHMAVANGEWRLAIGGVKPHARDEQLAQARELSAGWRPESFGCRQPMTRPRPRRPTRPHAKTSPAGWHGWD